MNSGTGPDEGRGRPAAFPPPRRGARMVRWDTTGVPRRLDGPCGPRTHCSASRRRDRSSRSGRSARFSASGPSVRSRRGCRSAQSRPVVPRCPLSPVGRSCRGVLRVQCKTRPGPDAGSGRRGRRGWWPWPRRWPGWGCSSSGGVGWQCADRPPGLVTEGPHGQRVTRRRRRAVATGVLLVAIVGAAFGVVLTATAASPGGAAAISYCSAARSVDEYHGRDHAHLVALLERVQRRAPTEIASVVVAMRQARPTSAAFSAARSAWSHYNTNHCCSCIGSPSVPQLTSTVPPHRTP